VSAVAVTLREITEANLDSVLAVRTTPEQERFVSTVADSIAEAAANPHGNPWYRAVYADEHPVGFVMLSWDVEPQPPHINGPWFLWKLLIDSHHQRQGHGHEVLRQVVELVRRSCSPATCPGRAARPASTRATGSSPEETSIPTVRSSCGSTCGRDARPAPALISAGGTLTGVPLSRPRSPDVVRARRP
jgi:GNAT superfamily N-acetyltransferase